VHAAPAIAAHPDLELAGVWVHSDAKAGRDVGEVCGVEALGVTTSPDADGLLDLGADVICYMAHSDMRPGEVVDDLCRMLASGHNVVNTSFVPLLHPKTSGFHDQLEEACRVGGTTIYTSGIDPGYGNATLAIGALALCKEVRSVRMMEIINYATWDNAPTMFDIMGFGKPDPSHSILLAQGSTTMAWGPVLGLVAEALDVELDRIEERHEVIHADAGFEIASGKIDAGTISGMRFEVVGIVGGQERIVVEHVTRLRDGDAPEWPQGEGYRILIEGEPSVKLELELSSDLGDHNHAGCLATAMHVINAIPHVVAADPGVVTTLDLPNYSARHLVVSA
jgi:4-hydroxy-tetrahydrodipicolinate reductase